MEGEECTSTRQSLFFVETSNYMAKSVMEDHVIDNAVILEQTPVNDNDGVLEPTSRNDNDGILELTAGSDVNGVLESTLKNDDSGGISKLTLRNDGVGVLELTPRNDDGEVLEPMPGMSFKTKKDLIHYYKQYGRQAGFGTMTQRSKREDDGNIRYITLGCARGGKARKSNTNISKPRPTIKTDCKAKINAISVDGVLHITTVYNAHNHRLSPQKARFFRCNRTITDSVKRQLDINDKAGIGMSKNFNALVVEAGGFEKLSFMEKDARNYIDKVRHLRLGKGGVDALRSYFERMQYKNDGFYSSMDLDDDGRLKNVFWADARSRAAYEYFGDVVTFDTTYLTNRYGMPFAPFVGVNHHGQSILLGAGLISSENTKTFVWLFDTWLKCMDERAPKAIITDQDRAMKNAIEIVFPNTRHRYCLWHIMRKLPEKFGSHVEFKSGLKSRLQSCVYDSHTSEEFEKSWEVFTNTYNLKENAWLQTLYSERMYWVPVYLKNTFWAGMSTTQRSESMNAFFDGYVHSGTTLKEFVNQFDNALRKKVENEMTADFHSFNCTIPCISHLPLEKLFQAVYTNSKFKEIQLEVMGIIYSHCVIIKTEGAITTYEVNDSREVEGSIKKLSLLAYFNEHECEVKCICGLFETRGILCRHMLSIFISRDVKVLPEKYILERWRKDITRRYALIRSSYDDLSDKPAATRYSSLIKLCYEVATNACEREDNTMEMIDKLKAMNLTFSKSKPQANVPTTNGSTHIPVGAEIGSSKKLLSPRVVRGKGRPPSKRKQPTIERLQTKRKNGAKRQGKKVTSHNFQDVLNPMDVVNQISTPHIVPSQLAGTKQNVSSQVTTIFGVLDGETATTINLPQFSPIKTSLPPPQPYDSPKEDNEEKGANHKKEEREEYR